MLEFTLTGFLFAIVNFLILVALLYKFLHKPLLDVLDKRRTTIEGAQKAARAAQAAAETLKQDCETQIAGMEEDRDKLLTEARREAAAARDEVLDKARHEAEREIAGLKRDWERKEREATEDLQDALLATSLELTRAILAQLTDHDIETKLLDALLAELAQLGAKGHDRTELFATDTSVRVTSAVPLGDADRKRLCDAISQLADAPQSVDFSEDPNLIAGVRVEFVALAVDSNLADTVGAVLAAAEPAAEPAQESAANPVPETAKGVPQ